MSIQALQFEAVAVGYWSVFLLASIACYLALSRARDIDRPDVRNGMTALLATTGTWALLKVVYFLAPDPFREPAYTVGLIIGFTTVWAFLYFCSAYTGRDYHKDPTLRRLGAGAALSVIAVKVTNPLHGLYFSTTARTEPFEYLAIEHGVFHWTVTGLSYTLAAIGIFMLFEQYLNSGYNTRPLGALTLLLALPVSLDILALFTPLIEVIYAPLGVAAFALGVLYIFERRFLAIQSSGDDDDAVIFLDDEERIRDYTPAAVDFFPPLEGSEGAPLDSVLPRVAAVADTETQVLEYDIDGERRYLLTSISTVTLGESEGSVLLFSDVTSAENRRRELQRHNEQLEGFASALAHELRNMLQIIEWRLGIAKDRIDEGSVEHESIEKATTANERLSARVDDFTTLAKYGQTIERLESVDFGTAVRDAWWNVETGEMDLRVEGKGILEADPGRLRELLGNAFVFARMNEAETVTVELFDSAFAVADDGNPPGQDTDGYLEFGESVPSAEAGMKLPNAKTFARVHGWEIEIDTEYQAGVRLVVSDVGVDREQDPPKQETD